MKTCRRAARLGGQVYGALAALSVAGSVALGQVGAAPAPAAATNTLTRATSVTRQFVAFAYDPVLPSVLCVLAEHIKRDWLGLLNVPDAWADPIVIFVNTGDASQANTANIGLRVFRTDYHLKYQIDCVTPPPVDEATLAPIIVEALIAEAANRDLVFPETGSVLTAQAPLWLAHGAAQSGRGRTDQLLDAARRSIATGQPPAAADLLAATTLPADPLEREFFEVNTWLFTEGLVELPDGRGKLRRFITELGTQKSSSNAFWAVYRNDFPTDSSLEKWLSLRLSERTAAVVAGALNATDTAQRLSELLQTNLERPRGRRGGTIKADVPMNQLWRYYDQKWFPDVIRDKLLRVEALGSQAHPLYRPVIDGYAQALRSMMDGSVYRYRRGIAAADAARRSVEVECQQTAAYLDRAEQRFATAGSRSALSDYLDQFDR